MIILVDLVLEELIKEKLKDDVSILQVADSAEPKSIADFNERGLRVIGAKKGADSINR